MSKIIPKDWVEPAGTGPLEITKEKMEEMVAAATAMVTEPIEEKDLADKLEKHYVFEKGEHYTSKQLEEVVREVARELYVAPPVEEMVEAEVVKEAV